MSNRTKVLLTLTPEAAAQLSAAAERLALNASTVAELLIRRYGATVKATPALLPADARGRRGNGRRKPPGK